MLSLFSAMLKHSLPSLLLLSLFSFFFKSNAQNASYPARPPILVRGVHFHSSCSSAQVQTIQEALKATDDMANEGYHATVGSHDPIYDFFFRAEDRPLVANFFINATRLISGFGLPVQIVCKDLMEYCATEIDQPDGQTKFLTYNYRRLYYPDRNMIVLCPLFFTQQVLPAPCKAESLETGRVGLGSSQAGNLLFQLATLPWVAGSAVQYTENQGNYVLFSRVINTKESPIFENNATNVDRFQPRNNALSYVHLANWAWIRTKQHRHCRKNWPLFGVLKDTSLQTLIRKFPENEKPAVDEHDSELRKLLSVPAQKGLGNITLAEGLYAVKDAESPAVTLALTADQLQKFNKFLGT